VKQCLRQPWPAATATDFSRLVLTVTALQMPLCVSLHLEVGACAAPFCSMFKHPGADLPCFCIACRCNASRACLCGGSASASLGRQLHMYAETGVPTTGCLTVCYTATMPVNSRLLCHELAFVLAPAFSGCYSYLLPRLVLWMSMRCRCHGGGAHSCTDTVAPALAGSCACFVTLVY
jgi:hypothetical protein